MTKTEVIAHYGTASEVARVLGITQPSVSNWPEKPPILQQLRLERLTNGKLVAGPECEPYRVKLWSKDAA